MSWLGDCTRCGKPTVSTKDPRYRDSDYVRDPEMGGGVRHVWCPAGPASPPRKFRPFAQDQLDDGLIRFLGSQEPVHDPGCLAGDCRVCMAIVEGLYPDSVSDRVKELRRQGKLSVALRDLYSKGSRPQRAARPPESPIETKFLAACRKLGAPVLRDLVPQHPVAGYRIDFALPARKIGIELDGFATHSSTADIENDRRRQRDLEGRGWYIIRFGGREVNRDADHCAQQAAWLIEHARKGGAS